MKARRPAWLASFALACFAGVAGAHTLGPSLLDVRETEPGIHLVRWKTPLRKAPGAEPRPVLPAGCATRGEIARGRTLDAAVEAWTVACGQTGLVGAELAVTGLGATKAPVLLRVELADGRRFRSVLTAAAPSFRVPTAWRLVPAYVVGCTSAFWIFERILGVPG